MARGSGGAEVCGNQRGLGVVLLERPAGAVPLRFYAQEEHPAAIGKEAGWLPGGLVGHFEMEVAKPGAIGVQKRCATLRREEEPGEAWGRGGGVTKRSAADARGEGPTGQGGEEAATAEGSWHAPILPSRPALGEFPFATGRHKRISRP